MQANDEAIRLEAELTAKKVPIDQWPQDIRWEWDAKANWNRNLLAFQRYALVRTGIYNAHQKRDPSPKWCWIASRPNASPGCDQTTSRR